MSFGAENSQDLSEALLPDDKSWELDLALGTCYSADLKTILFILYRLLGHDPDSEDKALEGSALYQSFLSLREKIRIFHDPGHYRISQGDEFSKFLDEVMREYPVKRGCSFHPKTLVLKFKKVNEEGASYQYRLIVLSRNFTTDTSLDVMFAGELLPGEGEINDVSSFVGHLNANLPKDDTVQFSDLANELGNCKINPLDGNREVRDIHFFWQKESNPLIDQVKAYIVGSGEVAMISPFVKAGGLEKLYNAFDGQQVCLVSTKFDLDKGCYQQDFCDLVGKGKVYNLRSDDNLPKMLANLHAKLILCDDEDKVKVMLGSSNFSNRGLNGKNIEAVVTFNLYGQSLDNIFHKDWTVENTEGKIPIAEEYIVVKLEGDPPEDTADEKVQQLLSQLKLEIKYEREGRKVNSKMKITGLEDIKQDAELKDGKLWVRPYRGEQVSVSLEITSIDFIFKDASSYTSLYEFHFQWGNGRFKKVVLRSVTPFFEILNERVEALVADYINREGIFKQLDALLGNITFGGDRSKKKDEGKGDWGFGEVFNLPVNLEKLFINCIEKPEKVKLINQVFKTSAEKISDPVRKLQFIKVKELWDRLYKEGAFNETS